MGVGFFNRERLIKWGGISLPLLFLGLFYFYPLWGIMRVSFAGEFSLSELWERPYYLRLIWFTFWQAVVSTVITILLAIPGAHIFVRYQFWGKRQLLALSSLPFVLPTIVVANAFSALLGRKGVLNLLWMKVSGDLEPIIQLDQTIWIIFLAHIFYNYTVVLRILTGFWQNMGDNLIDAGMMLGGSKWKIFWHITLPLLRPALWAAAILLFVFTFTSFGVILILGGPRFATLEVEIYRQAVQLFNLPIAAVLSLGQILFTLSLIFFYSRAQKQIGRIRLDWENSEKAVVPTTVGEKIWLYSNLSGMIFLIGAPLLALIIRSVWGADGFTFSYYQQLFINKHGSLFFVPPGEAIINSTIYALGAMGVALFVGGITAVWLERYEGAGGIESWLDPIFMLPLSTSAVTLGFGYIVSLNKGILNLRDSWLLVLMAHALIGIPFVIRTLLPALRRIRPQWREAASLLGANSAQLWWEIDWPLVRPAFIVAAVFAFTVSMGEFGATSFIARPERPTIPIAIFRFLSQPGSANFGQALAMSVILLFVCGLAFLLIEYFDLGEEGEF